LVLLFVVVRALIIGVFCVCGRKFRRRRAAISATTEVHVLYRCRIIITTMVSGFLRGGSWLRALRRRRDFTRGLVEKNLSTKTRDSPRRRNSSGASSLREFVTVPCASSFPRRSFRRAEECRQVAAQKSPGK